MLTFSEARKAAVPASGQSRFLEGDTHRTSGLSACCCVGHTLTPFKHREQMRRLRCGGAHTCACSGPPPEQSVDLSSLQLGSL